MDVYLGSIIMAMAAVILTRSEIVLFVSAIAVTMVFAFVR